MRILQLFKRKSEVEKLENDIVRLFNEIKSDFGGGCAFEKASVFINYIIKFNITVSVDIGVYRGRSLFPQALAHKMHTKGIVYGIDPYLNETAIQNDRIDILEDLHEFAKTTDFESIYNEVQSRIDKYSLSSNSKLIRKKSEDAISFFIENKINIGLIHIDGNHDTEFVMKDVNNYFDIIDDNGIIVLDDISWDSVRPAYDKLCEKTVFIGELIDNNNDFAVFVKTNDLKSDLIEQCKLTFKNAIKK